MRRSLEVAAVLIGVSAFGAIPASAAPVLFNGHGYEFIAGAFTFDQASAAAQAQTFNGVSGHLVTISSSQENAFVLGLIASVQHSVWIGATDRVVEGEWRWVTGEQFWQGNGSGTPLLYANWALGQPDDFGSGQDVATIFGGLVSAPGVVPGQWDDGGAGPGTDGSIFQRDGYLVEFEAPAVPEPATVILLAAGLGMLRATTSRRARRDKAHQI
jgi:hypothetical protein